MSTKLRLALDWTPNTNHSGFYTALAKGWYKEAGIELEIVPPSSEYGHEETPARRVVNGTSDLCVAPSESVISCWTSDEGRARPRAVAAVLQNDTSAILTLKSSGLDNPSKLDGQKYASYQGRFEMAIIRQMVKNAGGAGEVIEVVPPKLDCFDAVIRGEAVSTWIFQGWEGLQAASKGVELNTFPLASSGVPYGYTPVLLAHPRFCEAGSVDSEILKKFLQVSSRGYQHAAKYPEEAADALFEASQQHPTLLALGKDFLLQSSTYLASGGHYLDESGEWGKMDPVRWEQFVEWLFANDCITARDGSVLPRSSVNAADLYTNEFLL